MNELEELGFADRVALALAEVEMTYERQGNFVASPDLSRAAHNFCLSENMDDQKRIFFRLKELIEAKNAANDEEG